MGAIIRVGRHMVCEIQASKCVTARRGRNQTYWGQRRWPGSQRSPRRPLQGKGGLHTAPCFHAVRRVARTLVLWESAPASALTGPVDGR